MALCCHGYLVFMAWALAVLRQALQSLVDQSHVLLVDVEPQQAQATCRAAADAVQKLKSLTHEVVVCLVALVPQEVLEGGKGNATEGLKTGRKSVLIMFSSLSLSLCVLCACACVSQ